MSAAFGPFLIMMMVFSSERLPGLSIDINRGKGNASVCNMEKRLELLDERAERLCLDSLWEGLDFCVIDYFTRLKSTGRGLACGSGSTPDNRAPRGSDGREGENRIEF